MYKFTFLADLHYYSKTLGTSGRAYELRSGSDQKCLAESGAIIDAAFDHLARSDTQAVLLAGDLTNDGEMVCHRELREKLYALAPTPTTGAVTATRGALPVPESPMMCLPCPTRGFTIFIMISAGGRPLPSTAPIWESALM